MASTQKRFLHLIASLFLLFYGHITHQNRLLGLEQGQRLPPANLSPLTRESVATATCFQVHGHFRGLTQLLEPLRTCPHRG